MSDELDFPVSDEGAQTRATLAFTSVKTEKPGVAASRSTGVLTPSPAGAGTAAPVSRAAATHSAEALRQTKIIRFDDEFPDDVSLAPEEHAALLSAHKRIKNVQSYVGHGNFSVLGFDDLLRYARKVSDIGAFTPGEIDLMERLFYDDASTLGFLGERVFDKITQRVSPGEIEKIPGTGQYLYNGEALNLFQRLRRDVGEHLVLTSGVRGVAKQYQLFIGKAVASTGNLSKASRSLAPPGHSYHGIGDFDVGKRGFHKFNFTAAFAETDVYNDILHLDYISIRYTASNRFGVRYEPWHVRVV